MVIIMNPDATQENISEVIQAIESAGLQAKIMEGVQQKIVGVIGDKTKMASVAIGWRSLIVISNVCGKLLLTETSSIRKSLDNLIAILSVSNSNNGSPI